MKLKNNEIIIYPTDTVWGIGCNTDSETGYKKIAEIKKTDPNKPLSILYVNMFQMLKDFNFPSFMNEAWLRTFFSHEATLGLPVAMAKANFKRFVYQNSDFISIRFLEIKNLRDLDSPIFTTSLNISGQPAIVSEEEAKKFREKYAKDSVFITSEGANSLSGESSTIVFFKEEKKFDVLREGRFAKEIRLFISNNIDV